MNTQHTPGPWHIGESNPWLVYAPDGYAVADTRTYHGRHADTKADARLIAASPELLAALIEATECLIDSGYDHEGNKVKYMRAIIAKATGKETA
jgi:hypothetical protein